jgi:signal transduction histidine kinase
MEVTHANGREWMRLTIEDDGPGVPGEIKGRIFEPFFTTKKDFGTGLGLWVTKEIVDRHEGTIELESPVGDGTGGARFSIQLPCEPAD